MAVLKEHDTTVFRKTYPMLSTQTEQQRFQTQAFERPLLYEN